MASRGRTSRARWQRHMKYGQSQRSSTLVPQNHPGGDVWRRFPKVTIETSNAFSKEEVQKWCDPYGKIVGCRMHVKRNKQRLRNSQGYDQSRRGWESRRVWNDRFQSGADIRAIYEFTYTTDGAAFDCVEGLHGATIGGYRISAWSHQGEKRCCPRHGRNAPGSSNNEENVSFQNESSELVSEQTISTIEPVEKCVTSNEAINILEGCEIITPGNFELLNYSEKMHTSAVGESKINEDKNYAVLKNGEYENVMYNTSTIDQDVMENKIIIFNGKNGIEKEKKQREFKDVVINIENCDIFSNEDNFMESQEMTTNKISGENTSVIDTGYPIETENLELNTSLEFLQVFADSGSKESIVGNEQSNPFPPTRNNLNISKNEKKKKKKNKKERSSKTEKRDTRRSHTAFFSISKGNWRCIDPSCNFTNSSSDELCEMCKMPCPEAMKQSLRKKDESESYNKYYLAYAKSSVEIYVQDYTQHRDASKMTEILNKRFENGNIPPDKISKDGEFAVLTEEGWVRGRVLAVCNGIKCSLQHIKKKNFENIQNQEETNEIMNNTLSDYKLLNSSFISHENNINIDNIHGEYQERNVKMPYIESTSSVLEHQIMVEVEFENATIIQKYFNSLLAESENKEMVQSFKYLDNENFEGTQLTYSKEIKNEKYGCISYEGKIVDSPQEQKNNVHIIFSDKDIPYDLSTSIESAKDEEINIDLNALQKDHLHLDVKVEGSEEVINNENFKFCHVSLIDIGKQCCVPTDNVGLLLHELAGISEMKTGPVYLDNCKKIDNETEEKEEEGRKWLESVLKNKPFQIKWKSNEKYAQIFINDTFFNKEVCDRGYAIPRRQICHKCGKLGHMIRECPEVINRKKCYTCGDLGHQKQNCPLANHIFEKMTTSSLNTSCNESEIQSSEKINSTANIMKLKILKHSPSHSCMTISSSHNVCNPVCQECGKTGHQSRLCPIASGCSHCGSRMHRTCHCHNVIINKIENCSTFTSDCNTIDTYGNSGMGMTDMVTDYDGFNVSPSQHRFRNLSECIPTINFNWSPYHTIRSNTSLQSSIFETGQNPNWITPNYIYAASEVYAPLLEEADRHLSHQEGMVRALKEELTRIRTTGFVGLLGAMEKMKSLINTNASLAKRIVPIEQMERAIAFLKDQEQQMGPFINSNCQVKPDELQSDSKSELLKEQGTKSHDVLGEEINIPKWLTPEEQLGAMMENPDKLVYDSKSESLKEQESKSHVVCEEEINIPKWLTPQEQLGAMKVHQETVQGIMFKNSPLKGTRHKQYSTYEDAINHYYNWKDSYKKCYYKVKTYYNSICDEWINFSNAAKDILNGAPVPSKPDDAFMKKFFEQARILERLAKETEEIDQNLPEIILSRINYTILQMEKNVSELETNEKSKKQLQDLTEKENPLDLSLIDESSCEITLAQYVQNTREPLPHSQVDRIIKEILEEVKFEHDSGHSFGSIHPQNVLISDEGITLCPISDISAQTKIGNWDFTAPEALQGKPCKTSDIYSIGKIIMWLTICNESVASSKPDLLLEVMPFVREMIQDDPVKRPSIHEVLSHELFALPLHREADKSRSDVERKSFLSIIEEDFLDEIQETLEESI